MKIKVIFVKFQNMYYDQFIIWFGKKNFEIIMVIF